jgi:thioredoxin reductase (NADPH)
VRSDSVKRVASAVGEGSVVVAAVHRHLAKPPHSETISAAADAPQDEDARAPA